MTLKHGDLIDCVYPDISVDEYESKTGDNAEVIVVAFYTIEEDAAKDLDDFIEKSSIEVLDVDISPNPTEDGKYMVFVEMKRAPDFFEKFFSIIEEVENLSGELDWKVTTRSSDHEMPLHDEELKRSIYVADMTPVATEHGEDNTSDLEVDDESDSDEEVEFDDEGVEDEVEEAIRLLNHNNIIAEEVDGKVKLFNLYLDIIDCDSEDSIAESFEHIPVDFTDPYECRELRKRLGLDWEVTNLKECVALKHNVSGNVIIARV